MSAIPWLTDSWLPSNGSATLTAGAGTVSNWSIALVPSPGTNTLTVHCVDIAGNTSAAVSRTFFYKVPAKLGVLQCRNWKRRLQRRGLRPRRHRPANGAMLNLGESYTITAIPDKFSLFSNWVSAALVSRVTPALSFVMQSNLVLTANFVTNFFSAAGRDLQRPLLSRQRRQPRKHPGCSTTSFSEHRRFQRQVLDWPGRSYPFATKFDVSGQAAFNAGPLQVDLALDTRHSQITGTVSASQWTANLIADLASNTLPSAEYTMLFSPSTNVSADSPPGDGYALVTNDAGIVTLSGALADGTRYSQTVPVSQTGDLPVYASLYTNTATTPIPACCWAGSTSQTFKPPRPPTP